MHYVYAHQLPSSGQQLLPQKLGMHKTHLKILPNSQGGFALSESSVKSACLVNPLNANPSYCLKNLSILQSKPSVTSLDV